ncbi:MAG: hypothetical protein HRS50_01445 [Mycoplasmataceae bacterium]|nr:hypothetical protein [Mycoplasmataceae bacterium]
MGVEINFKLIKEGKKLLEIKYEIKDMNKSLYYLDSGVQDAKYEIEEAKSVIEESEFLMKENSLTIIKKKKICDMYVYIFWFRLFFGFLKFNIETYKYSYYHCQYS